MTAINMHLNGKLGDRRIRYFKTLPRGEHLKPCLNQGLNIYPNKKKMF